MKKIISLAILASSISVHAANITSHSYLAVRPEFQSGSPELFTLFQDRMDARDHQMNAAIQVVVFSGKSRDSKKVAKYFLPYGKSQIIAGGFNSQAFNGRTLDVISHYFGVFTANPIAPTELPGPPAPADTVFNTDDLTFQSKLCLRPKRTVVGVGFQWKQHLCFGKGESGGLWFSISAPLERVTHNLHFNESIENAGSGSTPDGFVSTMEAALTGQPVFGDKVFKYGKISPCTLTETKIADVELKVGTLFLETQRCYLEAYVGGVVPTGNKPTAEFMFEPVVGNGHHGGVLFGASSGMALRDINKGWDFWALIDVDGRYLFANNQKRSFDLIDKSWSRYIWIYPTSSAQPFADINPGINYLTQEVSVKPRFQGTMHLGLGLYCTNFIWQTGYVFFARSPEHIELKSCFDESFGIAGIDFDDISNTGAGKDGKANTQSRATMKLFEDALNDEDASGLPEFIPIKSQDIDLNSGAQPCANTHTLYFSIGYRDDACEYPLFMGTGGSYEFATDNAALEKWLFWIKGGISF